MENYSRMGVEQPINAKVKWRAKNYNSMDDWSDLNLWTSANRAAKPGLTNWSYSLKCGGFYEWKGVKIREDRNWVEWCSSLSDTFSLLRVVKFSPLWIPFFLLSPPLMCPFTKVVCIDQEVAARYDRWYERPCSYQTLSSSLVHEGLLKKGGSLQISSMTRVLIAFFPEVFVPTHQVSKQGFFVFEGLSLRQEPTKTLHKYPCESEKILSHQPSFQLATVARTLRDFSCSKHACLLLRVVAWPLPEQALSILGCGLLEGAGRLGNEGSLVMKGERCGWESSGRR